MPPFFGNIKLHLQEKVQNGKNTQKVSEKSLASQFTTDEKVFFKHFRVVFRPNDPRLSVVRAGFQTVSQGEV